MKQNEKFSTFLVKRSAPIICQISEIEAPSRGAREVLGDHRPLRLSAAVLERSPAARVRQWRRTETILFVNPLASEYGRPIKIVPKTTAPRTRILWNSRYCTIPSNTMAATRGITRCSRACLSCCFQPDGRVHRLQMNGGVACRHNRPAGRPPMANVKPTAPPPCSTQA